MPPAPCMSSCKCILKLMDLRQSCARPPFKDRYAQPTSRHKHLYFFPFGTTQPNAPSLAEEAEPRFLQLHGRALVQAMLVNLVQSHACVTLLDSRYILAIWGSCRSITDEFTSGKQPGMKCPWLH